jgi:hypothetical protein
MHANAPLSIPHTHTIMHALHLKALTEADTHIAIAAPTIALLPCLLERCRRTLHAHNCEQMHANVPLPFADTHTITHLLLKALTVTDTHVSHSSADSRAPPETATTLPMHPACMQLSVRAIHMHSNA